MGKNFCLFIFAILWSTNIVHIEAHFDFTLWFCRFKCDSRCAGPSSDDPSNQMKPIKGYYWRDYHGVIPIDAFPLGPSNQFPQTYIAMVLDKKKTGLYATTLVKRLDYAYLAENGTVQKHTKHIQILCTMEPERLMWFKLSQANIKTIRDGDLFLKPGFDYQKSTYKVNLHYIARAAKCGVNYAGTITGIDVELEYALMDGTKAETKNFLMLAYRKPTNAYDKQGKNKDEPFFSHHYEYQVRKDSIMPTFYKKLKIGSCSVTCTNEGADSERNIKKKEAASAAMDYYWKPSNVFDKNEGLPAGNTFQNETLYIGQSYNKELGGLDVGQSGGIYVDMNDESKFVTFEWTYNQVFSTQYPNKFIWVNSTTATFAALDNSTLIPGGILRDGTEIFIGRTVDNTDIKSPGSIRVLKIGAHLSCRHGTKTNFEVLSYKNKGK